MTGMKLINSTEMNARNTTIVGLSAALGVGIAQASSSLSQFPAAFTIIFGKSPVVIATLLAIVLNLILPKDSKVQVKTEERAEVLKIGEGTYGTEDSQDGPSDSDTAKKQ